jgi:hypothetical protein
MAWRSVLDVLTSGRTRPIEPAANARRVELADRIVGLSSLASSDAW